MKVGDCLLIYGGFGEIKERSLEVEVLILKFCGEIRSEFGEYVEFVVKLTIFP